MSRDTTPKSAVAPLRVVKRLFESAVWEGDCLCATGTPNRGGYVLVYWREPGLPRSENRRAVMAHRISWWVHKYDISGWDQTVDHICRNTRCINIEHLRILPNEANGRLNGHSIKKVCPQGHPYHGENLYAGSGGQRWCRICVKNKWVRKKASLKGHHE